MLRIIVAFIIVTLSASTAAESSLGVCEKILRWTGNIPINQLLDLGFNPKVAESIAKQRPDMAKKIIILKNLGFTEKAKAMTVYRGLLLEEGKPISFIHRGLDHVDKMWVSEQLYTAIGYAEIHNISHYKLIAPDRNYIGYILEIQIPGFLFKFPGLIDPNKIGNFAAFVSRTGTVDPYLKGDVERGLTLRWADTDL